MAIGRWHVNLHPIALVDPAWVGRDSFPPLRPPDVARLQDWVTGDKVFLAVASDAFAGDCKRFAGRSTKFDVPIVVQNADARVYNRTARMFELGVASVRPWLLAMINAVVSLTDFALTVRVFCGSLTTRCAECLRNLGAAWCLFLRRLRKAIERLPPECLVVSALNTSVAILLEEDFPEALLLPITGLANGKLTVSDGLLEVENITAVFVDYVDYALLLGEEMLRFGSTRVAKAAFHGEAVQAGIQEGRMFRADVLLWILAGGDGGAALEHANPPRVVEVGVDRAHLSAHLLQKHASLRWLGVDIYLDGVHDLNGGSMSQGALLLQKARRLAPWLSGPRAQLLVANSTAAADLMPGVLFDIVFIDAGHSWEAATADLLAWAPHVRPGGVLAGHDYCGYFHGVVEAVNAALPRGAVLHLAPDFV
eukprot:CAMPEP_0117477292 /NCGR_PEP_ID=MMETSP0784-20121206/10751_1 /TAXON_ID=39447 /ORGANISM="" /LENGTH=422 /DNA_ID=CAMNT_0005271597 /DNA_START=19 /DNA_END=1284 /DNA_ORIENTATION=+